MNDNQSVFWQSSLPLIRLLGSGVKAFLNGQTTSNFSNKNDSELIPTCWLNNRGSVKALLEVRLISEGAEIVLLAANKFDLFQEFEKIIFPSDKVLVEGNLFIHRLQVLNHKKADRVHKSFWLFPDQKIPHDISNLSKADFFEFEKWRIENGLPISTLEIDGRFNPFELGLSDLIDVDKGCYLGQEIIAKFLRVGKNVKELRVIESTTQISSGEQLYLDCIDTKSKRICGEITSVIYDNRNLKYFGLGMIKSFALSSNKLYLGDNSRFVYINSPSHFCWN